MKAKQADGERMDSRRPIGFWHDFNTWWRSQLSQNGCRPSQTELAEWFDANAMYCWRPDDMPSLKELRTHAKCLRSTEQVRLYFRKYRAARKATSNSMRTSGSDDDSDSDGGGSRAPSRGRGGGGFGGADSCTTVSAIQSALVGCGSQGPDLGPGSACKPARSGAAIVGPGSQQYCSAGGEVPSLMPFVFGPGGGATGLFLAGAGGALAGLAQPMQQPAVSGGGGSCYPDARQQFPQASRGRTPYAKYTARCLASSGLPPRQPPSAVPTKPCAAATPLPPAAAAVSGPVISFSRGGAPQHSAHGPGITCSIGGGIVLQLPPLQRTGSANARLQSSPARSKHSSPAPSGPPPKRGPLCSSYSGPTSDVDGPPDAQQRQQPPQLGGFSSYPFAAPVTTGMMLAAAAALGSGDYGGGASFGAALEQESSPNDQLSDPYPDQQQMQPHLDGGACHGHNMHRRARASSNPPLCPGAGTAAAAHTVEAPAAEVLSPTQAFFRSWQGADMEDLLVDLPQMGPQQHSREQAAEGGRGRLQGADEAAAIAMDMVEDTDPELSLALVLPSGLGRLGSLMADTPHGCPHTAMASSVAEGPVTVKTETVAASPAGAGGPGSGAIKNGSDMGWWSAAVAVAGTAGQLPTLRTTSMGAAAAAAAASAAADLEAFHQLHQLVTPTAAALASVGACPGQPQQQGECQGAAAEAQHEQQEGFSPASASQLFALLGMQPPPSEPQAPASVASREEAQRLPGRPTTSLTTVTTTLTLTHSAEDQQQPHTQEQDAHGAASLPLSAAEDAAMQQYPPLYPPSAWPAPAFHAYPLHPRTAGGPSADLAAAAPYSGYQYPTYHYGYAPPPPPTFSLHPHNPYYYHPPPPHPACNGMYDMCGAWHQPFVVTPHGYPAPYGGPYAEYSGAPAHGHMDMQPPRAAPMQQHPGTMDPAGPAGPPEASSTRVRAAAAAASRRLGGFSGSGVAPATAAAEPLMPGRYVWQATAKARGDDGAAAGEGECGGGNDDNASRRGGDDSAPVRTQTVIQASYCSHGHACCSESVGVAPAMAHTAADEAARGDGDDCVESRGAAIHALPQQHPQATGGTAIQLLMRPPLPRKQVLAQAVAAPEAPAHSEQEDGGTIIGAGATMLPELLAAGMPCGAAEAPPHMLSAVSTAAVLPAQMDARAEQQAVDGAAVEEGCPDTARAYGDTELLDLSAITAGLFSPPSDMAGPPCNPRNTAGWSQQHQGSGMTRIAGCGNGAAAGVNATPTTAAAAFAFDSTPVHTSVAARSLPFAAAAPRVPASTIACAQQPSSRSAAAAHSLFSGGTHPGSSHQAGHLPSSVPSTLRGPSDTRRTCGGGASPLSSSLLASWLTSPATLATLDACTRLGLGLLGDELEEGVQLLHSGDAGDGLEEAGLGLEGLLGASPAGAAAVAEVSADLMAHIRITHVPGPHATAADAATPSNGKAAAGKGGALALWQAQFEQNRVL